MRGDFGQRRLVRLGFRNGLLLGSLFGNGFFGVRLSNGLFLRYSGNHGNGFLFGLLRRFRNRFVLLRACFLFLSRLGYGFFDSCLLSRFLCSLGNRFNFRIRFQSFYYFFCIHRYYLPYSVI